MGEVDLVACVTTPQNSAEIRDIPREVRWLQIRSDLIGDIPAAWLRSCFTGQLMYSLKSWRAGGSFERSQEERHDRLVAAAKDYDLVEIDTETDLSGRVLAAVPPSKRIISWYGHVSDVAELHKIFERIAETPARYYLLVCSAAKTNDGLYPLLLMKALKRNDVIAISDGPSGLWSRLLAPHFGSPFLFGQLNQLERHRGEFHIKQLMTDYGYPVLRPLRCVYGMVGNRLFQSPSPRLHNTSYRQLGCPALFVPFHVESFEDFWQSMAVATPLDSLGVPIQGLIIVSPYKEAAVAVAGLRSAMVRKAESTNVFIRRKHEWEAETTDPESIAGMQRKFPLKAAVIGCGGAGRAVAVALQQKGAAVTLVNRGQERGEYAAQLLGLPFVPLATFRAHGFDLIVNATPVGRDRDCFPFIVDSLSSETLLIDLAYGTHPTPLVSAVTARGGTAIDGYDVLLTQVRKQFQLLTGLEMSANIGRDMVLADNAANFAPRATVLQDERRVHAPYEYSFEAVE
jgi:3-dehydroquinate dehydratase / shikimate dehydrogenase